MKLYDEDEEDFLVLTEFPKSLQQIYLTCESIELCCVCEILNKHANTLESFDLSLRPEINPVSKEEAFLMPFMPNLNSLGLHFHAQLEDYKGWEREKLDAINLRKIFLVIFHLIHVANYISINFFLAFIMC